MKRSNKLLLYGFLVAMVAVVLANVIIRKDYNDSLNPEMKKYIKTEVRFNARK